MTQQTNNNPALHQTVLDLVNDNATDAETRLSAIVEAFDSFAKLDEPNTFEESISCEKSIVAGNSANANDIRIFTTSQGAGVLAGNIDGATYNQIAFSLDGRVDIRYQGISRLQTTGQGINVSNEGGTQSSIFESDEGDSNLLVRTSKADKFSRIAIQVEDGTRVNKVLFAGGQYYTLIVDSEGEEWFHDRYNTVTKEYSILRADSGARGLSVNSTGGELLGTWTGTVTSDQSIKENIQTRDGLANILQLNGINWDWKEGCEIEGADTAGFTADNWQEVYPEDVMRDEEDDLLKIVRSLDTQVFEADVVEAIKSQQQQIDELKAIVENLTSAG